jgi:hypothetical protein
MKEVNMDVNWRTVQFFLGDNGVAEVLVDAENHNKVMCTCKLFEKSQKCPHSIKVRMRMRSNDGHYKIQIPDGIPDETVIEAMKTAESFRDFILHYGKVEIL